MKKMDKFIATAVKNRKQYSRHKRWKYWQANANLLEAQGKPGWMVQSSRKYARRIYEEGLEK